MTVLFLGELGVVIWIFVDKSSFKDALLKGIQAMEKKGGEPWDEFQKDVGCVVFHFFEFLSIFYITYNFVFLLVDKNRGCSKSNKLIIIDLWAHREIQDFPTHILIYP